MPEQPDRFDEIRPYRDEEVAAVLSRLCLDADFLRTLVGVTHPQLGRWVPRAATWAARWRVRRLTAAIRTVRELQDAMEPLLRQVIESTTRGFSVSGVETLPQGESLLFVSNHRDIVMDPAFINFTLWHQGMKTVHAAIGDNLLSKSFVADLMRLNKSFIVKRSAKGPRETLRNSQLLSEYVRGVLSEGGNVWIAQREGRAKDGDDRTDPAVIKMLQLAYRKSGESLKDAVRAMQLVPVSLSYEFDPCDRHKARELDCIARHGRYKKTEHEDLEQIALGVKGDKGRVHLHFGAPLQGDYRDADEVALAIDAQIHRGYRCFPSHWLAWQRAETIRTGTAPTLPDDLEFAIDDAARSEFWARFEELTPGEWSQLLRMYAQPVHNQLSAQRSCEATSAATRLFEETE